MTEFELAQWSSKWHKIDPDKSNYIDFHQYYEIRDWLGIAFAQRLQESNDSLNNHALSTIILQGPEPKCTGSRFIRWLKKKLVPAPEILRIIFDDKYYTDVDMAAIAYYPVNQWYDMIMPHVRHLIIKSKEETKHD